MRQRHFRGGGFLPDYCGRSRGRNERGRTHWTSTAHFLYHRATGMSWGSLANSLWRLYARRKKRHYGPKGRSSALTTWIARMRTRLALEALVWGAGRPRGEILRRVSRALLLEPLERRLPLATYIVLNPGDNNVNTGPFPGTGTAADPFQAPTLREAILAANKSPGTDDTITFASSLNGVPITLTIPNVGGTDENVGMTGDLDVSDSLTIVGNGISAAGSPNITIQGGTSEATSVDKVLAINPNRNSAVNFTLMDVTVRFGVNTQGTLPTSGGGGLDWEGFATSGLTIKNCVFANNQSTLGYGGGINIDGISATGSVSITNTAIVNNKSDGTGGGINILGDHIGVTISGSTIANNTTTGASSATVEAGGGGVNIGMSQQGSVSIDTTTISGNNAAGFGGGVRVVGNQAVTVTNTAIVGNTSHQHGQNPSTGGGLLNQNNPVSPTTLTNVLIAGNHAEEGVAGTDPIGGGVVNFNTAQLSVRNSTISGNVTTGSGGGLATTAGPTNLLNVTISNNVADEDNNGTGQGGGIRVFGGQPIVVNTIVAGNFRGNGTIADDVSGTLAPISANNLIANTTGLDILADNGGPIVGATIGPGGLAKVLQTHALLAGSPALDGGDNTPVQAVLATDQRGPGFLRIIEAADLD